MAEPVDLGFTPPIAAGRQYRNGTLSGYNPGGVFSQLGGFIFTSTNQNHGGGRYFDHPGFVFSPVVITVRSNLTARHPRR